MKTQGEPKVNIITHTYDLLKYLVPQLIKFPRSQKFVLADRIQNQLTDILGLLIEAYYTSRSHKAAILQIANIEHPKHRWILLNPIFFLTFEKIWT